MRTAARSSVLVGTKRERKSYYIAPISLARLAKPVSVAEKAQHLALAAGAQTLGGRTALAGGVEPAKEGE